MATLVLLHYSLVGGQAREAPEDGVRQGGPGGPPSNRDRDRAWRDQPQEDVRGRRRRSGRRVTARGVRAEGGGVREATRGGGRRGRRLALPLALRAARRAGEDLLGPRRAGGRQQPDDQAGQRR